MGNRDTALSRNGSSDPGGRKLTCELKTMVSEIDRDDFVALSRMEGRTAGEALRDLIVYHLRGRFGAAQRKIMGNGSSGERHENGE